MVASGVGDAQARPPQRPRPEADQVEVAERERGALLREDEAVAQRRAFPRLGAKPRDLVELFVEERTFGLHAVQVAGHAAVEADQRLLLRMRLREARGVHHRTLGLAAGGRELSTQAASVLLRQEVLGQARVDVIPGQRRVHGERGQVGPLVDAQLFDRFFP